MFFMPGSHKDAELGRAAGGFGNINKIFSAEDYPEWQDREMVPMVLKAGDATFHSGMCALRLPLRPTPPAPLFLALRFAPSWGAMGHASLLASFSLVGNAW
jgi:hypothetical protein